MIVEILLFEFEILVVDIHEVFLVDEDSARLNFRLEYKRILETKPLVLDKVVIERRLQEKTLKFSFSFFFFDFSNDLMMIFQIWRTFYRAIF